MKKEVEIGSVREFKLKVHRLHHALGELIPLLKLGHSFNYMSQLHGYKDWHCLKAIMVKGDDIVDISSDLHDKAGKLHSLLQPQYSFITVQDCYECLHFVYPLGNVYIQK